MGVWDTKNDCLNNLYTGYSYADYYRGLLAINIENAIDDLGSGDIPGAVGWLITCLTNSKSIFGYLIRRRGEYDPEFGLIYFLENYTGVTWQSIVFAWLDNDFEGRAWTIATIDRMRQILWDEPFQVVWAARPEDRKGEL